MIEIVTVVAIIGVLAAIAAPMMGNAMANFRLSGDARAVSNAISLAKMRASATFSQSRAYFDLGGGTYHIEIWSKTNSAWQWDVGSTDLNTRDSFGFGAVSTPPANTQGTIGQAPACLNNAGTAIGNTACVVFNSRGIPIDSTGGFVYAKKNGSITDWKIAGHFTSPTTAHISIDSLDCGGSKGSTNLKLKT